RVPGRGVLEVNRGSCHPMNDSLIHASVDTCPAPAPSVRASLLFQGLRWRLLRNTLNELVRRSPVRLITILVCSALIWGGVFTLSWLGFTFFAIELKVPLNGKIIGTLFNLLFVVLTVLLVFSTGIILYSSLFSSDETTFLLSTPAPADQVFAFKYQG